MTGDPRRALTRLLNAFENHFDIARDGDEADDAALEAAELALRDAFFTYDDILFTQLGVELPFDILDDSDEDDEEDDSDYEDEDSDFEDDEATDEDDDDDFIEVDD
ncbi:MAG: DNA primase [Isoptericola variabilis]|nr:DNA primase [Isoptericola variabilis]